MTDNSESYAKRISSFPPDEFKRISGTYAIEEESKMLERISQNDDISQYDLSKWENVGVILNSLKTWKNLPEFIQYQIRPALMQFIQQNFPFNNEQLKNAIWDFAIPHLKEYNLDIEVEEATDENNPDKYSVVDIRIVKARQSISNSLKGIFDDDYSERDTIPDTPISKIIEKH
jgi:hypothetical protein